MIMCISHFSHVERGAWQYLSQPCMKAIKDDSPSHRFGRRQGFLGSALMAPASCRAVSAVPLTVGLGTCCLKGEQSEEQVLNGLSLGQLCFFIGVTVWLKER